MTELARRRAAVTKVSKRKAAAAAKTSNIVTEKETAHAAKTEKATDTMASARAAKADAAARQKRSKFWPDQIAPDRLTARRR